METGKYTSEHQGVKYHIDSYQVKNKIKYEVWLTVDQVYSIPELCNLIGRPIQSMNTIESTTILHALSSSTIEECIYEVKYLIQILNS